MPRIIQPSIRKRRHFVFALIMIAGASCLVWPSHKFNWLSPARAATEDRIIRDNKQLNGSLRNALSQVSGNLSLGNYPATSVNLGTSATITPDSPPTNALGVSVYTSPDFNGTLTVNPTTGTVRVTNPYPMGTYAVKVRAFDSSGTVTIKTFQLTVQAGTVCQNGSVFTRAADIDVDSDDIAVGDFNNDGHQDIASLNASSQGYVSIRLGNGAGGFTGSNTISLSSNDSHQSIAIGDFNNDGNQDLVILNFYAVSATIRPGDGTGAFPEAYRSEVILAEPPWTHPGNSAGPVSVAIGDFNNDGNQDLAVANRNASKVAIRLGDGKGLFFGSTEIEVDNGAMPLAVAIADFNNDGNQDFVTANSRGTVSIRLGNGAVNFNAPAIPEVHLGFWVYSIAVGDFNNDGKQDFAVGSNHEANVAVRLGDGAGGFTLPTTPNFNIGSPSIDVVSGDFNNDGNQDLAASTFRPDTIAVRMGNGTGNFSAGRNISVSAPASLVVGDFNGDGKQDIAADKNALPGVSIHLGACNTAPVITPASVTPTQGSPTSNFTIASTVADSQEASDTLTLTVNGAASATQNGVTISNLKISVDGVATADILAECGATNANFTLRATDSDGLFSEAQLTISVAANPAPTLVYASPQSVTYAASLNVTPTTANDNGAVTYQIMGGHGLASAPTVNSSGVVSITNAQPVGQHTITVHATDNCNGITDQTFTLNVTQANQTITFGTIPNRTFGDVSFDVIATASSGLPVSFSIVSGPATLNGHILIINGAGTVTVRASQTGNNNYHAATPVEQTFTINRGMRTPIVTSSNNPAEFGQSVTFTAIAPTIAGVIPTGTMQFKVNGSNFGTPVILNASGIATLTTSGLAVGTHSVTVAYSGDVNFVANTGTMGTQVIKSQPRLTINDLMLTEGNDGTTAFNFMVRLSATSSLTVGVDYATANATATAGSDYQTNTGTLTFNPGETSKTITVLVNGDTGNEINETFSVNLSNPINANILDGQGVGTIVNDDAVTLQLSQTSYSVGEGAGQLNINVARAGDSSIPVTVNFSTSDTSGASPCDTINGIASSRCDYAPRSGTLQFGAGETSKSFSIPLVDDGLVEGTERLTIKLSSPAGGASLGPISTATISITDNEITGVPPPLELVLDESGPEPNQAAAIDSTLLLRDPFPVISEANLPNQTQDRNTRVIIFVTNLQLAQNETPLSVVVNLLASNNQSYEIGAQIVQPIPYFNFTQVIFRLPDNLAPGTCTIKVKAHGQESNSGTIRIRS